MTKTPGLENYSKTYGINLLDIQKHQRYRGSRIIFICVKRSETTRARNEATKRCAATYIYKYTRNRVK